MCYLGYSIHKFDEFIHWPNMCMNEYEILICWEMIFFKKKNSDQINKMEIKEEWSSL